MYIYIIVLELDLWFISGVYVLFIWRIVIWGSLSFYWVISIFTDLQVYSMGSITMRARSTETGTNWFCRMICKVGGLFQLSHADGLGLWVSNTNCSHLKHLLSLVFCDFKCWPKTTLHHHYRLKIRSLVHNSCGKIRSKTHYETVSSTLFPLPLELEFCWNAAASGNSVMLVSRVSTWDCPCK